MQEGNYIEIVGIRRQTESERERKAESSTPGFAGKGGGRGWVEKGGWVRRSETRSDVESTCLVNSSNFALSSSTFI